MGTLLLDTLSTAAADYNAGVNIHSAELNVEYVRGQAELICSALGLPTDDYAPGVVLLILDPSAPQDSIKFLRAVYGPHQRYLDVQQALDVRGMLQRVRGHARDSISLARVMMMGQ